LPPGAAFSSQETIGRMFSTVLNFIDDAPQHDDMTMVVVRVL